MKSGTGNDLFVLTEVQKLDEFLVPFHRIRLVVLIIIGCTKHKIGTFDVAQFPFLMRLAS